MTKSFKLFDLISIGKKIPSHWAVFQSKGSCLVGEMLSKAFRLKLSKAFQPNQFITFDQIRIITGRYSQDPVSSDGCASNRKAMICELGKALLDHGLDLHTNFQLIDSTCLVNAI